MKAYKRLNEPSKDREANAEKARREYSTGRHRHVLKFPPSLSYNECKEKIFGILEATESLKLEINKNYRKNE